MRLPFVPGPSDVRAAVDGVRDGVGEALELLPRLTRIVGRVEQLLDRVEAAATRIEGVALRADQAVSRAEATLERTEDTVRAVGATHARVDETIAAAAATREKADEAITAVGTTTEHADGVLTRAEGLVVRLEPLVGAYEGPLGAMAPSVRRLADTLEPHEVEAMVQLIDQLPSLVTHLEQAVLPTLASMGNVGTDVHDLLDTMQDLRHVVKGFPGSRLLRRRGAEEIAQDEAEETGRP